MRRNLTSAVCGLTFAFTTSAFAADGEVSIDPSDVAGPEAAVGRFVPEQYVVVLRGGVARAQAVAARHGVQTGLVLGPQRAIVMKHIGQPKLAALAADPDVEAIYPDAIASISGKPTPPPPAPEALPPGIDRIGADEIANKGAGVTVCVVDTGIDYRHRDLAANYVGGRDFINNDNDPNDDNGHGTHVAGTIAAVDNDVDVIGVAPQARLLAAKALDRRGNGAYSAITAGINYCVAQGAPVINMSLGGPVDDPVMRAALQAAREAGVTVVVAAGNSGVNLNTSPEYPAAYDGLVITVSAAWVEEADRAVGTQIGYPTFSNYGSAVDLSAPGTYIVSTAKGGGLTTKSGTSMACPHVAGAAALYLSAHPGTAPADVEAALEGSLEDVNNIATHPEEMLNVRSF